MTLRLSDFICTKFSPIFEAVMRGEYQELVLLGGRGSTKSSVATIITILYVLTKRRSAIVLIKYKNGINARLINIFIKYIRLMGLDSHFKITPSRACITLLNADGTPSNVDIMFSGCDDPEKLKSISPKEGAFGLMWIEEASNFKDELELLNISATFCRGGDTVSLYSFNPPKSKTNWANIALTKPKPGRYIHTSTYLDVVQEHPEWLGVRFVADAEYLKESNNDLYNYMYLGIPTGTGGEVFPRVSQFKYSEMVESLGDLCWGLDFGHTNDPSCLIGCKYISGTNTIYICKELWIDYPILDVRMAEKIKQFITQPRYFIYGDSASGSRIDALGYGGVCVGGVPKPKGSVHRGIEFMSKCDIYIDPDNCPNTFREFSNYAFRTLGGRAIDDYVDKDNHSIDATRYALYDTILSDNPVGSMITLI